MISLIIILKGSLSDLNELIIPFLFSTYSLEESRTYHQIDQEQIARQNQQLADLEGEISMLRRSIESLEKEKMRQSNILAKMNDEMEKLRMVCIIQKLTKIFLFQTFYISIIILNKQTSAILFYFDMR